MSKVPELLLTLYTFKHSIKEHTIVYSLLNFVREIRGRNRIYYHFHGIITWIHFNEIYFN